MTFPTNPKSHFARSESAWPILVSSFEDEEDSEKGDGEDDEEEIYEVNHEEAEVEEVEEEEEGEGGGRGRGRGGGGEGEVEEEIKVRKALDESLRLEEEKQVHKALELSLLEPPVPGSLSAPLLPMPSPQSPKSEFSGNESTALFSSDENQE